MSKKQIYPTNKLLSRVLNKVLGTKQQETYYDSFFQNVKDVKNKEKGNILIYAGIGNMYLSPVEIVMYHLLRQKGFSVDYYIYDENIPSNEVITKERVEKQGKDVFWNKSVQDSKALLKAAKVDYQFIEINPQINDILPDSFSNIHQIFNFRFDNIDFGNIVKGVMYRFYKSLTFGDDALEVGRNFLVTSIANYLQVKKLNEQKKYKYLLFSHGIYCTWQPVEGYCKESNVDYICYDRAKTKGHCNFNLNTPSPIWDISEAWKRIDKTHLSTSENKEVESYLNDRILQKNDVFAYNFSAKEKDTNKLKQRLRIAEHSKVITIFTNLIWDAANVSRDIAFKSPLDCIIATIQQYQNQSDVHILIRTHPAEKVLGTKERYGNLVKNSFDKLPDNVTIIEPEDNINSFSVLEISNIGIVHTSTVGLEMAIEGKPVILLSDTHYRDKGFTYDAQNKNHYFELLDNQLRGEKLLPNQVKLAKKYFYLMMFEYQHKMPMEFSSNNLFDGYGYPSFEELLQDKNAAINKIISRITEEETLNDFIFY